MKPAVNKLRSRGVKCDVASKCWSLGLDHSPPPRPGWSSSSPQSSKQTGLLPFSQAGLVFLPQGPCSEHWAPEDTCRTQFRGRPGMVLSARGAHWASLSVKTMCCPSGSLDIGRCPVEGVSMTVNALGAESLMGLLVTVLTCVVTSPCWGN